MNLDPFVGGLAIGIIGAMVILLGAAYYLRRMRDHYERCIRSRDTRIQLLINQVEHYKHAEEQREKELRRENCLWQTRRPLK